MRLVRLLLLICIVAALLSWIGARQDEALKVQTVSLAAESPLARGEVDMPVTIGGPTRKALRLAFSMPGNTVTADLVFKASSAGFELIDPKGNAIEKKCSAVSEGSDCRARVHLTASDQYVTILASSPVTLAEVKSEVWAKKRVTRTATWSVITVLLLLLLLAPLFWLTPREASQYLLIGLGGAWLFIASWQLAFMVLAILSLNFVVLRMLMGKGGAFRWFAIGLGLTIGALFIIKAIVPLAADFFANPGEFFFLPIGFSYFVIRMIDLLFKAYSRQLKTLSATEYLAYLLFPPTLAAGPIMNIFEFRSNARAFLTLTERTWGLLRVGSGLVKKAAADLLMLYVIAPPMDGAFYGSDNSDVSAVLLANVLFVYLDFSAYSDIAIGVARWWGWRVPENFDWPLLRSNMREFWRHWHMSLTQWVTRHVFMQASMEVRRSPRWMQVMLPAFMTMLVIGLWHGFVFIWVLWALHHLVGIKLGDAAENWSKRAGTIRLRGKLGSIIGPARVDALRNVGGIAFVWWWVALSHAFTTTTKLSEALSNYLTLLTGGLVAPL